jgi:hypothetical protein
MGGLLFSRNTLSYFGVIPRRVGGKEEVEDWFSTCVVALLAYSVAALGVWFQLSLGFALPFPLNILLFPLTAVEYLLVWLINHSAYVMQ